MLNTVTLSEQAFSKLLKRKRMGESPGEKREGEKVPLSPPFLRLLRQSAIFKCFLPHWWIIPYLSRAFFSSSVT